MFSAFLLGAVSCQRGPDPSKTGSYSSYLSLSVGLAPVQGGQDSEFVVTLRNACNKDLDVRVSNSLFEGAIYLTSKDGNIYKLYDKRFVNVLLTSMLDEPIISLRRNSEIRWRIPFRDLRTINGDVVAWSKIAGGYGYAVLKDVAVDPGRSILDPKATVMSDNASQTTTVIFLPEQR
jgi:hypothetical protein